MHTRTTHPCGNGQASSTHHGLRGAHVCTVRVLGRECLLVAGSVSLPINARAALARAASASVCVSVRVRVRVRVRGSGHPSPWSSPWLHSVLLQHPLVTGHGFAVCSAGKVQYRLLARPRTPAHTPSAPCPAQSASLVQRGGSNLLMPPCGPNPAAHLYAHATSRSTAGCRWTERILVRTRSFRCREVVWPSVACGVRLPVT